MKILLVIMLFAFVGCNEGPVKNVVGTKDSLIRAFRNSGNWDSVYVYSDGHLIIVEKPVIHRYFMVSYTCTEKNGGGTNTGEIFFSNKGFPNKNFIDSAIYAAFELKRSCYQSVVILSMFEFKDSLDFYNFGRGHIEEEVSENKKCCK